MHRAADRGAVTALVPRRQLEVAAVLRHTGVVGRRCVGDTRERSPTRTAGARPSANAASCSASHASRSSTGGAGTPAVSASADGCGAASIASPPRRRFPQQLGRGALGRFVGHLTVGAVHRHDEMVARARRDVEEAQLLGVAHLLVDRLVQLEGVGLRLAREPHLVRAVGREQHLHRSRFARSPWCVVPEHTTIGNSRPLAPWIVMMRTASSSVSGSTVSTTRAPSVPCSVAQAR